MILDLRRRITSQHHAPKLQDTRTLEDARGLSPTITGGHRCPATLVGMRRVRSCLRTRFSGTVRLESFILSHSGERWDVISVDFIGELPDSHGQDAI